MRGNHFFDRNINMKNQPNPLLNNQIFGRVLPIPINSGYDQGGFYDGRYQTSYNLSRNSINFQFDQNQYI